ncbi:LuxR C-terminal-related transcriptional regulator [Agrobacterium tumefaciens]|uniref:LuxR C-terminal-related transcriptional regulator n=1 Tax=Agrobacterium tumefaciens TaxID=358 RepID=UPI003BA1B315
MDFDLFGNPLDDDDPRLGRPEHQPTEENIIFVMVLLAAGQTNKEVAAQLGLSVPTFRKHYLHLIKHRDRMLERLKTKLRVEQIKLGISGNASALNAALTMLDKVSADAAEAKFRGREKPKQEKTKKLGKKEERQIAAQGVSGKFAPPSAPKLIVDNRK